MKFLETTKILGKGIIGLLFSGVVQQLLTAVFKQNQHNENLQIFVKNTDAFTLNLLVLSAAVVKADASVQACELDFVNRFFIRNYGAQYASERMVVFCSLLKKEVPIEKICVEIRQSMDYGSCVRLMNLLAQLALSDGVMASEERLVLEKIANILGLLQQDACDILGNNPAIAQKYVPPAYTRLGITPTATNQDIKRAYRQLANETHPDKFNHLSENVRQEAEVKFRNLQEAYQKIKRERLMV